MLSYFIRYRNFIKLNLFVAPPFIAAPVLGLENVIRARSLRAFETRKVVARG